MSDTRAQGPGRVRWYRRLSVRLTLLVAVMSVGFLQLARPVTHATSRWLGLDILDPFVVVSDDDGTEADLGCGIPVDGFILAVEVAGAELTDAEASARADELELALADWPCFQGAHFAVLSPTLEVLLHSGGVGLQRGKPFDPGPAVENFTAFFPLRADGAIRCWLAVIPPEVGAGEVPEGPLVEFVQGTASGVGMATTMTEPKGDPSVLTEKEADTQWSRFTVISAVVSWGLPLGAALLVGMFVSWTVSRRIARLGRAAADPSLAAVERFKIGGRDELAQLGESMADARARIAGLMDQLAEKDSQRREWFAQVSHDLRTPLTALSACLERAEPLVDDAGHPEARQDLAQAIRVARQDAERVQMLATDLLDVARLELPGSLMLEDLLPEEFAERAVTGLEPLAGERGVSLQFHGGAMPCTVRGDGHRLLRAMENLVRNAIDHATSAVLVSVTQDGEAVRIAVTDDGPGFRVDGGEIQLERPGRSRADSAGLGLVVVERVLAAHGSELELENRVPRGAIAQFRLDATLTSGVHRGLVTT